MLYYEFEAGNNVYKLRLNTREIINLEKKLNGRNPVSLFGGGDRIPTHTEMIYVLHHSLQPYHHGITMDRTIDIFDAFINDGHTMTDFVPVMVKIYATGGILPDPDEQGSGYTEDFDAGDSEKN